MAAAGYTPISLYYSTTASQAPTNTNLVNGELAINITDGKLYYKDNAGVVQLIASKATAGGTATNIAGGTTGALPYQSGASTTTFLSLGTSGYVLTAGASAPQYVAQSTLSVGTATNVAGGTAGALNYQTGSGATSFLALGTTGYVLTAGASAPQYTALSSLTIGNADAVKNTGAVATNNSFYIPFIGNNTTSYQGLNTTSYLSFNPSTSTLVVGTNAALGGTTNPITAFTGSTNNYVQTYIYNANTGTSASADFVAYANNSTDSHGWADVGFTSSAYADTTYTITGPNEAYLFGSAPSGSGKTGNLVYGTDNTGTENSHQWYVGGFTQLKSAWKMQLTSTNFQYNNVAVTGFKTATFNSQTTIATTTGSITVDWTSAQNQKQTEPTGTITYTFTAPPGPCHLQLIIDSDGTSTAQTINWPGTVTWMGSTWAGTNNKKAVINFWYDGSNYLAIGTNQA